MDELVSYFSPTHIVGQGMEKDYSQYHLLQIPHLLVQKGVGLTIALGVV